MFLTSLLTQSMCNEDMCPSYTWGGTVEIRRRHVSMLYVGRNGRDKKKTCVHAIRGEER